MALGKPGQTLEATALVHEAYLRLVDREPAQHWNSRGHFFGAAAEAMGRILVEKARRNKRQKHGGDRQRIDLTDQPAPTADDRLLALDEALARLVGGERTPAPRSEVAVAAEGSARSHRFFSLGAAAEAGVPIDEAVELGGE